MHFLSKMNKMNKNILYKESQKVEKAIEFRSSKQVFYNPFENF